MSQFEIHLDSFDKLSDFQKVNKLNEIIDAELEKPVKLQDKDLLDECMGFLADIVEDSPVLNSEMVKSNVAVIMNKVKHFSEHMPKKHPVKSLKVLLIAAAITATIIACTVFVSATTGINLFERFGINIHEIFKLPDKTPTEMSGYTVEKTNIRRKYATIEEAIEKEQLDLLYPQDAYKSNFFDVVDYFSFANGWTVSTLFFEDQPIKQYYVTSDLTYHDVESYEKLDIYEKITVNSIRYYIYANEDGYWAEFTYDGNWYILLCSDESSRYEIIQQIQIKKGLST